MGVGRKTSVVHFPTMKRRDDQVTIRLAAPLRAALEDEAAQRGRGLSHLIRLVLINYATQRVVERGQDAA